jgi:hypothetical protein
MPLMTGEEDGRICNLQTPDSRIQHRRKNARSGLIRQTKRTARPAIRAFSARPAGFAPFGRSWLAPMSLLVLRSVARCA